MVLTWQRVKTNGLSNINQCVVLIGNKALWKLGPLLSLVCIKQFGSGNKMHFLSLLMATTVQNYEGCKNRELTYNFIVGLKSGKWISMSKKVRFFINETQIRIYIITGMEHG